MSQEILIDVPENMSEFYFLNKESYINVKNLSKSLLYILYFSEYKKKSGQFSTVTAL